VAARRHWDEGQPLLEAAGGEVVKVCVPRRDKGHSQTPRNVDAKLTDVARAGDVDDVRFEPADGLEDRPPVTPEQQVVTQVVFEREGQPAASQFEA
jgi:hypothetical protein